MKKYQVNSDYEGAVVIGETPYHANQIIVDDGTKPKVAIAIEKLLKLDPPSITAIENKTEEAPVGERLTNRSKNKEVK